MYMYMYMSRANITWPTLARSLDYAGVSIARKKKPCIFRLRAHLEFSTIYWQLWKDMSPKHHAYGHDHDACLKKHLSVFSIARADDTLQIRTRAGSCVQELALKWKLATAHVHMVRMRICMYLRMKTRVHVHVHIDFRIHAYLHAHTHPDHVYMCCCELPF